MMSGNWMQDRIMELEGVMQSTMQQQNALVAELAQLRSQQSSNVQEGNILQKMIKACKVESYQGDRSMGVLEGWLYRMEVHMSYFPNATDEEKGKFARSFLLGTASTWLQTWERDQLRQGIPLLWSRLKEGLVLQFKAIDALTTARMKLWELKQTGDVQHYVDEFRKLQVQIMDMSPAEALDTFKRGLKKRIQSELILRDPKDVNEAIALAQRIQSTISITEQPVGRPQPYYGPMPMELGNLQQQANLAPRPFRPQEPLRQPRANIVPNGGMGRVETRQCYRCGRFGHIQANCRIRRANPQNRRPLNEMEIRAPQVEENEENL
jgi:hypothetical protein